MELVALKTDLAFRAVFGRENERCKTALKSLLNTMLDLDIADITYVNPLNSCAPRKEPSMIAFP